MMPYTVAHSPLSAKRTTFMCRCHRRITFPPNGALRTVCGRCGTIHVRGALAEAARIAMSSEREIARECGQPGPTVFRVTGASTITITGADGMYGIRAALRFVCTYRRCAWTGPESKLSAHHQQHLDQLAASEAAREVKPTTEAKAK